MANGNTHAKVGWLVAGVTLLVAPALASIDPQLAAGAVAGAVMGVLVTPDIDMERARTKEEARVYRYLGRPIGWLYQLFWRGYARRYAHRGVSHKPIAGTFTRWRYVLLRLSPLLILAVPYWLEFLPAILVAFAFHALQDIVHLMLDGWRYTRQRG